MDTLLAVFRSARPPFIILTPATLALGMSCAWSVSDNISVWQILLVLLAGIFAHISVNQLNEYSDFSSGLDFKTEKTPFSGGSGALVSSPTAAKAVLFSGIIALLLTFAIGAWFVALRGWPLALLGTLGGLIILTYTRWINLHPWLCLIAPGIAFGPLMVLGTQIALVGQISNAAWLASVTPFCLANGLLLLNQLPDIEADKSVGRNHFAIRYGKSAALRVFLLLHGIAIGSVLIGVMIGWFPIWVELAFLGYLPLIFKLNALFSPRPSELLGVMGANVATTILTPIIMAVTLTFPPL